MELASPLNIVWIDQPIGSGFSQGTVTARDENDVAKQFMGFWKNFIDTFAMQGYKIYVTGSSYSGMYSPYIANAMLEANDKNYFNVSGMMLFDGLFGKEQLFRDIPLSQFVDTWKGVFAFNDSFTEGLRTRSQTCGYTDYMRKYLVFPSLGGAAHRTAGHAGRCQLPAGLRHLPRCLCRRQRAQPLL